MDQEEINEVKRKATEIEVLESELSSLSNDARVYKQLTNAPIFFLSKKSIIEEEIKNEKEQYKDKVKEIRK
ncbi:hypothetical protein H8356DRAFT_1723569 [Neocallimastix lanati (nom. inval.)]|uniref:Prefoldin n=1 Tax=Neocallimastix californiae TaxID=1754190 RepID=A0A1Y2C2I4_9FUNG|nr:hypothetical protein H8356DRAFT_1723569 [Neocallimastix sp. JGI-2020a]ORY41166.1 hypothetical protein LY90DRAFT_704041 [Neocallimastix californiae]|eukprot:ORY41166.1 hypothetical protein LY90DRAFT_704041 [Neocallimastix californiae]